MKKLVLLSLCLSLYLGAQAIDTQTANVTTAGTLSTVASAYLSTVTNLTITGTIDARDFVTMRDNMPLLAIVDMSGVTIAAYNGTEGTESTSNITYLANALPQYAFYNKSTYTGKISLKSLVLPTSITAIGNSAFQSCAGLTAITIPTLVTTIGSETFNNCIGLTTISLPSSLTTIGNWAFNQCIALTALSIPSSVISIGNRAFLDSDISITVDATNSTYSSIDGVLFNKNQTTLMYAPKNKTGSYIIPSSVNAITDYAFNYCTGLTAITIPSSVTSIKDYTFYHCSGLTAITLPTSLTTIGMRSFAYCSGFTGALTILSSVTSIGAYTFYNCSSLSSIKAYRANPGAITLGEDVFANVSTATCVLYVPVGAKTAYSGAAQWKVFTNIREGYNVPTITTQAISNIGAITATGNGTITGLGDTNPTQYGVVWSTSANPTVALTTKTTQGGISETGAFTSSITDLTANTQYHVRAYATNGAGTGYGEEVTFTTLGTTTIWNGNTWSSSSPTSSNNIVIDGNYSGTGLDCKNMTINAGKQVIISSGTLTIDGDLTLKSDPTNGTATLINDGSLTVSGNANVEQYLIAKTGDNTVDNWWYISSPVTDATSAVFNPASVATDRNLFGYYDEPTATYPQIKTNDVLLAKGAGYVLKLNGEKGSVVTYTFKGTLNDGDIPVRVSCGSEPIEKRGFNLVGNPYPSFLDWNALKASAGNNVRSTIWYRTRTNGGEMQFDTFDGSTGTDNGVNGMVSQYIPPMQAFWIKLEADNSSEMLTFKNSMRVPRDQSLTTNRLKMPALATTQVLRFKVSNGSNSDATVVVSDPNAQDGFDKYDSQKMSNNNINIPEIFTLAGTQELVINHTNTFSANKELALGFRPGKAGFFTLEATEISNLDSNLKVVLLDKLTNTEENIQVGTSYSFTSEATSTNNRFSILFKTNSVATGLDNSSDNRDVLVYRNAANQVTVLCGDASLKDEPVVTVYDAIGQPLIQQKLTSTVTEINRVFIPGVYIVTMNKSKQRITKKIIIN